MQLWVVLLHDLKLARGHADPGASWNGLPCRTSSATACVLSGPPGISYQAICAWPPPVLGLAVPQRPCYKLRPAATSARLGASQQEVWGMQKPDAACLFVFNLWYVLEKFTTWAKTCHLHGKATRSSLFESESWIGVGSQGITMVWRPVLARMMET